MTQQWTRATDTVSNPQRLQRPDQVFFPEKKNTLKKGNGFSAICIFAICYPTDKQASDIQAPGLHIRQYYNIPRQRS